MSADKTAGVDYLDLSRGRNTKSLVVRRIWVPLYFWSDHADRCPADNPETDMARELREAGRRVLIEGNEKQIETLRSDAAYYCDRDGPDECPPGLIRSARATVEAIRKATAS